LNIDKHIALT